MKRMVMFLCLLALCGGSGWRRDGAAVSGPAPRWRSDGALAGTGATGWLADGVRVVLEAFSAPAVVDFPVTDGLVLWLDFTDASTVALDGTAVLSVSDKSLSGNGATSTAAPTGAGSYWTGVEDVAYFASGGDEAVPLLQSPVTVTGESTIFLVVKAHEASGPGYMCPVGDGVLGGSPAGNSMFYINLNSWRSANYLFYAEGVAGWDATGYQSISQDGRFVYTVRVSASETSFGWLNGVFDMSAYSGSGATYSREGLLVGGPTYGVHNWKGQVYEVAYFNRPLSQAELAAVYGSLALKYGIEGGGTFSEEGEAYADIYFDPGPDAWVDPNAYMGVPVPSYIGELPFPQHSYPDYYTFQYWVDDQWNTVDQYYYLTTATSMTLYAIWYFYDPYATTTYFVEWYDSESNYGSGDYDEGTQYSSFLPSLPEGYHWTSSNYGDIGDGSNAYLFGSDYLWASGDM